MAATRTPTRRPAAKRRGNLRSVGSAQARPKVVVHVEELADFNDTVNILIHANSGVGKTVLAAFAPRAIFLSTEKGVVAAKRVGSKARLLRAPDWDHVEAALDWCDENLGPEDWLIIDSLSKMQILLIRWILRMLNDENDGRDIDIPQIQDHQKWQNMFMRFVDRMVDANYNTIFITTSMIKEDPDGDDIVLPSITGKDYTISNYVCAAMDIVLYYTMAKQKNRDDPVTRLLLAETFPPYFAKDRYNVLPRWQSIEEGDYTAMADIIADILEATSPEERQAAKAER
jgi:hypothetical protein